MSNLECALLCRILVVVPIGASEAEPLDRELLGAMAKSGLRRDELVPLRAALP